MVQLIIPYSNKYNFIRIIYLMITYVYSIFYTYRSICSNVGARFGTTCFSSRTHWNNAGMYGCCYTLRSTKGTIWKTYWRISTYTGTTINSFCFRPLILLRRPLNETHPTFFLYRENLLTCTLLYNLQGWNFARIIDYSKNELKSIYAFFSLDFSDHMSMLLQRIVIMERLIQRFMTISHIFFYIYCILSFIKIRSFYNLFLNS